MKEFDKKVKRIFEKYNVQNGKVDTPFGIMNIKVEKKGKLYWLFSNFDSDFEIEYFNQYFKYETINPYSKKWNEVDRDEEWILSDLDSRLNKLRRILLEDGMVPLKEPQYIF